MITFPRASLLAIAAALLASGEGLATTVETEFDADDFSEPVFNTSTE